MHFNSSLLSSKTTTETHVKRDLYSPQNAYKSDSYSPQISPSYKDRDDVDHVKTSREIYSSARLTSPKRDLYSPRMVEDQQQQHSTVYKTEIRKEIRTTQSPVFEFSSLNSTNRDNNDLYSKRITTTSTSKTNLMSPKDDSLYSTSYISKLRSENRSKNDSPVLISSPIKVRFLVDF